MFHDFPKNLLEFSTEVAQKNACNFHNCESIKRKAELYQEEIMVRLRKIILTNGNSGIGKSQAQTKQ